jgi:hypothetical protein
VAKTYALQTVEPAPGAGLLVANEPGGRVDLEEKVTNRQRLNFTEKQPFSQGDGTGLWIINPCIL